MSSAKLSIESDLTIDSQVGFIKIYSHTDLLHIYFENWQVLKLFLSASLIPPKRWRKKMSRMGISQEKILLSVAQKNLLSIESQKIKAHNVYSLLKLIFFYLKSKFF